MGWLALAVTAAATGASSYGESLLHRLQGRYPDLTEVQINAPPITLDRKWNGQSQSSETRPLFDANGNEIGTVTFHARCTNLANTDDLASYLSHRIYTLASLSDPDPFVVGATRAPAAQAMIEDALDHDPAIITLAFHVTPPGHATNSIVASSFGRIGKVGDADDEAVIREGKVLHEITNNGKRAAIELPLLDSHGRTIGALSTSFRIEPGNSQGKLELKAVSLRNAFGRRTTSRKALFRPATASRQVGILRICR